MTRSFQFEHPDDALRAVASQLVTTPVEVCSGDWTGRILATDVVADRDSPAADVSAMDGYAIRFDQLNQTDPIPVEGESVPGSPPPTLHQKTAVRVFTGAIVPEGCEVVVKREDTQESDDRIVLSDAVRSMNHGDHIRRAGENATAGSVVLRRGTRITAAQQATMTNFGCHAVEVHRRVRVSILTTGDEVGEFLDHPPRPWQLRNSNRAALSALCHSTSLASLVGTDHCVDDQPSLQRSLTRALENSDAVLLTGGVSMGDYDYVPDVIAAVGGRVIFHGLPIRPGKPVLGAATDAGKLIMGLPGNPISATVGGLRLALPLLARMSGQTDWLPHCPTVRLRDPDSKKIPLRWFRLVELTDHGNATLVPSQGSGDLVSLGRSTGFVEIPPADSGEGPWPYYHWP